MTAVVLLLASAVVLVLPTAAQTNHASKPRNSVTSCSDVTCQPGTECRIVINPKSEPVNIRPSCEDVSDIPKNAIQKRCGPSGYPVLELMRDGGAGEERKLRVYRPSGNCSAGLSRRKEICCSDTDKPGECPAPGDIGICVIACGSDNDCPKDKKCCPTGCPGSFDCTDPIPKLSCRTAKCSLGFECKETPKGPQCVPIANKTGECPTPGDFGVCALTCESDNDCPKDKKCCPTGCSGSFDCTDPVLTGSCLTVKCSLGFECEETPKGPQCVPIANKTGECPTPGDFGICVIACESDNDCPKDKKCCPTGCSGSFDCTDPVLTGSCLTVKCSLGFECEETPKGPQCVPIANKTGECPTPGDFGICVIACESDNDCPKDKKCCPTGCPGSFDCTDPVFTGSCLTVKCTAGHRCEETRNGPQCVPITKPGTCPKLRCLRRLISSRCKHECKVDADCKGSDKCCANCEGCQVCTSIPEPPSCDDVTCGVGKECVLRQVPCATTPCFPVPVCVDISKSLL